jgi:uncharacterized protein YgiM (DUF1202 family)
LLDASSAAAAAQRSLPADTTVRVLAKQEAYWLVEDGKGSTGWISAELAR